MDDAASSPLRSSSYFTQAHTPTHTHTPLAPVSMYHTGTEGWRGGLNTCGGQRHHIPRMQSVDKTEKRWRGRERERAGPQQQEVQGGWTVNAPCGVQIQRQRHGGSAQLSSQQVPLPVLKEGALRCSGWRWWK